jgi:hypothetical protein
MDKSNTMILTISSRKMCGNLPQSSLTPAASVVVIYWLANQRGAQQCELPLDCTRLIGSL